MFECMLGHCQNWFKITDFGMWTALLDFQWRLYRISESYCNIQGFRIHSNQYQVVLFAMYEKIVNIFSRIHVSRDT